MTPPANMNPEQEARVEIDRQLVQSGWQVQDADQMNVFAAQGVAVREVKLKKGHGQVDYLLFVDGKAVGVLEAKKLGFPLTGVEVQAQKYSEGLPDVLDAPYRPLPFCYLSTGAITKFTNLLDPHPRSRRVFQFHRPETLAEWLEAETLNEWVKDLHTEGGLYTAAEDTQAVYPPLAHPDPAPGSHSEPLAEQGQGHHEPGGVAQGTTARAPSSRWRPARARRSSPSRPIYRLIKFGGARRVLFLVDRGNLGEQAEKEFANYRTPDDNRKFTELYNVQRLTSNTIGSSSKVVITTIQRLYSMLKGEPEFDPEQEEESQFEADAGSREGAAPGRLQPGHPARVLRRDLHRRVPPLDLLAVAAGAGVLRRLPDRPDRHAGQAHLRLLQPEPGHGVQPRGGRGRRRERGLRGLQHPHEDHAPRARPSRPKPARMVGIRDRQTRKVRWEQPDEDITYGANDLDRNVVAKDQIRLIVRTFKEKLFTEIFPGRNEVPKTLIFAKDDSHAEDIVEIVREEFGKGNDFCQKITYKTTGKKPEELIQDFRNSYNPRIAVTVDMIATGTDIKPIEIVMFMRTVKSRVLFEQMKGRGVRVIDTNDLQAVTPDADAKTHFVHRGLRRDLRDQDGRHPAAGAEEDRLLQGPAGARRDGRHRPRAALLARQPSGPPRQAVSARRSETDRRGVGRASRSPTSATPSSRPSTPTGRSEKARSDIGLGAEEEPTEEQIEAGAQGAAPGRREASRDQARSSASCSSISRSQFEQIIDEVSQDELLEAGILEQEKAKGLVESFEKFLEENKDEIDALQFFYSQPYAERLHYKDIKALHERIKAPPRTWTEKKLWEAYELVETNKVHGASAERRLTDIVSLVRYALHQDDELVPFGDKVHERFENWLAQQENAGPSIRRRATSVAGDDSRPHRDQPGDRYG